MALATMSALLVGRALAVKGISSTDKLVLIGLADCTNTASGLCFPSVGWLAETVTETTERTVQRSLRRLETRGLIATVKRPGTSSMYTVFPPGAAGVGPSIAHHPAPGAPRGDICRA
jgi:pyocin large subunit-like protein